jgi:hypothetical protein
MKLHIVEVCSVALLLSATAVRADPVTVRQITGGQLVVTGSSHGEFSISGDGFDLQGRGTFDLLQCHPCQAGESPTFLTLSEVRSPLSGTVDGVTYPGLLVGNSLLGFPSVLNLKATASVLIPADATTGTQLTFPFTTLAEDRFVGYPDGTFSSPVFDFSVFGSGTGTVTLGLNGTLPNGIPFFSATQVDYRFDAAPSATPEPASVLLMVTGAGAILARRVRRAGIRRR